jgi:hypothetical protein
MCRALSDSPHPSLDFSTQISTHFDDGFDNVVARVTKRLHTHTHIHTHTHTHTHTASEHTKPNIQQVYMYMYTHTHTHTHVGVRVYAVVLPSAHGVYVAYGVYVKGKKKKLLYASPNRASFS